MRTSDLLLLLAVGVGYHEAACRGLVPWLLGTTPPNCWVPFATGCPRPYSPTLQAMLAQNQYLFQNAAEYRSYACSLSLDPGAWPDLQIYFIDHAYPDPGISPPPEWPSVSCFGTACIF